MDPTTRAAGVLLHPTSLPGPAAHGRLGSAADAFVEALAAAGFRWWQMLPVGPVDRVESPYQSASAFAGRPGFLDPRAPAPEAGDRDRFRAENAFWLDDWTLFTVLRRHYRRPWPEWPVPLRDREPRALAAARDELAAEIDVAEGIQWRFDVQWQRLKARANWLGVGLIGDLPLYCALDSADVWARRDWFAVDAEGNVTAAAGVPPDAFAAGGQLWGHPLHDWDAQAASGWQWWVERVCTQARRFDLLRIDHFRAFAAAWSIPPGDADATNGHWTPGPGRAPFDAIAASLGDLPLIAEDLGTITPDVEDLRRALGLPGMRVLQFAFDGGDDNPHRPHNHTEDQVVFTGTHDNDTSLGWWQALPEETRERIGAELGTDGHDMPAPLIDAALQSPARLAVVPLQDLLALGSEARMNIPGTETGNWQWRYRESDLDRAFNREIRQRLRDAGR